MVKVFGITHSSDFFRLAQNQVLEWANINKNKGQIRIGIELSSKGKGDEFFVKLEKILAEKFKQKRD